MKNYFKTVGLLSVLAVLLLSACSNDDGNTLAIVGVYTLTQESTMGCNDPADNSDKNKACTATDCETLTINANGTFSFVEVDNNTTTTIDGTYTLDGNQISFTSTVNNTTDTDVATYSLNNGILTLTFAADIDGCIESETYNKK